MDCKRSTTSSACLLADVVYLSTEGRFPENRLLEMIETRVAANPGLAEHLSGDNVLLKQAVCSSFALVRKVETQSMQRDIYDRIQLGMSTMLYRISCPSC